MERIHSCEWELPTPSIPKYYWRTNFNRNRSLRTSLLEREKMKQYQKRVVLEKEELDKKITKLAVFLKDPPGTVVVKELQRMKRQLALMKGYSDVLHERISAF